MTKKRAKTSSQLINSPEGDVKALMDQLTKITTLNNSLHQFINPTLSQHCRVVNIRKSTLVIAVDSSVWANKLRFQLPELLSELRQQGYLSLASIDLIIQPK
jgi:hypothetical protein